MRIAISGARVAGCISLLGRPAPALQAMNRSRPVAGLFTGSVRDDLDLPDYRID